MSYNFNKIEAKWQAYWKKNQTFKATNPGKSQSDSADPYYVLDMFPYPSGAGLHVGHPLGYIASDIMARYQRHQGKNVLHPMGYDSFGLPAEQYAIQTGQHPAITTETNINRYREQLDKIGFSFDWSREVRTSDPNYYRWTQWIFGELFKSWYDRKEDKAKPITELLSLFEKEGNTKVAAQTDFETTFTAEEWNAFSTKKQEEILLHYRLTYLAETEVNWCPQLGTVLANDEIVNGVSERGGYPVVRKKMKQWSMRISAYAERLLQDLNDLDWTDSLKESQRNWIGKSEGAMVKFGVLNANKQLSAHQIEVFTTRPDTIFGVSFMTLAPEHELVKQITSPKQKDKVEAYVKKTSMRSERERMADTKSITGAFTGAYAEHPFTKEPIPIWIADYVLSSYGTGAVMAVPAGDERDYKFAKHFKLPIPNIFQDVDISKQAYSDKAETALVNSDFLNGLSYKDALKKVIERLEELKIGKQQTNYRLRDAVFSRQRYWGEPFPIYYKNGLPKLMPATCLPLRLPEIEKYLPTQEGEPPLGRADAWYWNEKEEKVVAVEDIEHLPEDVYPIELNTMPGWAGSSWYFFRYMEASKRDEVFVSEEAINYWKNVDLYIGGSEHATGHLLYSRFWVKFLFDRGYVPVKEPFKKLINQGMILGDSALAYRLKDDPNTYISANLIGEKEVHPIHVNVSLVNTSNQLDMEGFKSWRPEFTNAQFITEEDGSFVVGREVEKMSKSKFNVVNPDDICEEYGADSLRLYEMFLGPLDQEKPWNTAGLSGVHSFLNKLWRLYHTYDSKFQNESFSVTDEPASKEALKTLHHTINKVTTDIESFHFNTAVSTLMICVNELTKQQCTSKEILAPLAILVAPYAPHIAEELWEKLGNSESISIAKYPVFEEKYVKEDSKTYPISFNGKKRFTLDLPLDMSKEEIEKTVMNHERTQEQLNGRTPKKIIVVPGRIVNIVG